MMTEKEHVHVMEDGIILEQECIAAGIYSMWLKTTAADSAKAGQFVSLYTADGATLLPRPISICEVNEDKTALRLVYRVVGKGTAQFSKQKQGETIRLIGPLGNGYTLKKKAAILLAGGIGIPPMVELAKELAKETTGKLTIVAGYRDSDLFLTEELKRYGEVLIATEDGSVGTKGNVLDVLREQKPEAEVLYACGPMPMLRAVKQYAAENNIEAQISLEERMACGIGACLGCVCKTTKKDEHTHVNNTRICTDGPVFDANDVAI